MDLFSLLWYLKLLLLLRILAKILIDIIYCSKQTGMAKSPIQIFSIRDYV